ncbi:NUMOD4 motif-containing HNH endonuclease [Rhodococcus sp. CX]|uniref:NUMOD4 domain-containing protein n=1 Tax=Rhodococcus sp. CX TaxID=2789880 RepID=UPI0018CED548|nr:NUMOD4 motif-containing HNH endonuclease [Rhodococcus sp. CX]
MEQWRPIPGYEGGYEVSDQGRVRSLDRITYRGEKQIRLKGKILSPGKRKQTGHLYVNLHRPGERRTFKVHRLVLLAFVGPPPAGSEYALHADDDPSNNRLSNLRWGSQVDNMNDMSENGHSYHANKSHCPREHEYSEANTRWYRGKRHCRECERQRSRGRYVNRKKEAT